MKKILVVAIVALSLAACQTTGAPGEFGSNKTTGGGIIGAVLGGVAGSQFGKGKGQLIAVGVGTLGGMFVGSGVGSSLDKMDEMYAKRNANKTLEYGRSNQPSRWQNPDSGHSGTFTAGPVKSGGKVCRPYTTTIYIDGKQETGTGTACRNSNGQWVM